MRLGKAEQLNELPRGRLRSINSYPIDITVAENWGVMQGKAEKEGLPMFSIDCLIAATA